MYRGGNDYIGEHADKTLDIKLNTNIINYYVGATRTMKLRTKEKQNRDIIRVKLKNNSAFILGCGTNGLNETSDELEMLKAFSEENHQTNFD